MDNDYWLRIDVDSESLGKVANSAATTILRKLMLSNHWPAPTQKILRDKTGLTLKNLELVKELKANHRELLKKVLCVTNFSRQKGTDILLSVINEKNLLTPQEIGKCKMKKTEDRVALMLKIYFKTPQALIDLYWRYVIQRLNFSKYVLAQNKGNIFFSSLNTTFEEFPHKMIIPKLKTQCYCWHTIKEDNKKIFFIRSFSRSKILHQLRTNSRIDLAKTVVLVALDDESIEVPAAAKNATLKIANALASNFYKTKCWFKRDFIDTRKSDLLKFGEHLSKNITNENIKLVMLKISRVPVDGNPTITFENYDIGLDETIKNISQMNINLPSCSDKIISATFMIDEKFPREIEFKPLENGKIFAVCPNRNLPDTHKKIIRDFFKQFDININFGSESID